MNIKSTQENVLKKIWENVMFTFVKLLNISCVGKNGRENVNLVAFGLDDLI